MVPVEYLAGFVDGEGYLGLARIRRRHRSPEYCLRLSIYNTNRAILEEIKRTTGGTMSVVGQRRAGWKPSYSINAFEPVADYETKLVACCLWPGRRSVSAKPSTIA